MHNAAVEAAGPEVERFAASASRWLGVTVIAVAVGSLVILAFLSTGGKWQAVALATAMGLLSWVVLVRPSVAVHSNGVLLRNMVRDVFVPSSQIVRCRAFQTLQVVTEERRFHGLGVSRSARSMIRERHGPRSTLGVSLGGVAARFDDDKRHRFANEELTGGSYSEYIESRVNRLGAEAKADGGEPVVSVAWAAVASLVLAGVLVVALFV